MNDVNVVEAIYAAMANRDFDRLFTFIDPKFVLTQDDRLPWGGRFEGHDGLVTFASALTGAITSTVSTAAMFWTDGDVIQYGRTRGEVNANGARFDIPEVHRWTVREGKAVRAHFSIDTLAMLEALAR